jgi:hypothetical protein
MRRMTGANGSVATFKSSMRSAARTTRRWEISNLGAHRASSTSARHAERTRTKPCCGPATHRPRVNPSSLARTTVAQASSSTSRRSVSSHVSGPSGRPAGNSQVSPSRLITTIAPSGVTQIPSAPCGFPSGGAPGGCHDRVQSCPFDRPAKASPSPATALTVAILSHASASTPRVKGARARALRPRGDSSVFRRFQTFQGDSHSETRVALPCFQLLNGVRLSITAGGG